MESLVRLLSCVSKREQSLRSGRACVMCYCIRKRKTSMSVAVLRASLSGVGKVYGSVRVDREGSAGDGKDGT